MKHLLLSIFTVFTIVNTLGQQQKPVSIFNKLVEVYNSNDSVQYANFYASVTSEPLRITKNASQMKHEYKFSGAVTLKRVKQISPTETELTLQTNDYGSWWTYLWVTDTARNFKEHHMRPVRFSGDFLASGKLSQREILDSIDAYLIHLQAKNVFAGNVFIARNGKVLYNKSFGKDHNGKMNNEATRFDLASMGKLFTSISILQLAEQHQLSLDDSIGKLMPGLSNKALYPITVRQLLTHTAGMGDYFEDPAFDPFSGRKFTRQDALPAVEKDKLLFAPGTNFRYSNTGFELLGLIVQKVSGMTIEDCVNKNIFTKADMKNTVEGVASGGATSTINDVYAFANALQGNKLLSPEMTAYFQNFHNANWGLGQEYQQLGNEVITGHSGGFVGVCTELNMYKNSGYTVIILSNTEPPYGHFLSDKIKELVVRN